MTEKQIRKIEKQIGGGVVRFMLVKGFQRSALAAGVFLFMRLLHFFGVFNWKPVELSETVAIIIGFFVAGCLSSFSYWDRLVEAHKKAEEQGNKIDLLTSQADQ